MLVNITWVFFRAKDFTVASTMLQSMAGAGGQADPDDRAAADDLRDGHRRRDRRHALGDARQDARDRGRAHARPGWSAALLGDHGIAVVAEQGKGSAFIYFQF